MNRKRYRLYRWPAQRIRDLDFVNNTKFSYYIIENDSGETIYYKDSDTDFYVKPDKESEFQVGWCDFVKVMTEEDLFLELL